MLQKFSEWFEKGKIEGKLHFAFQSNIPFALNLYIARDNEAFFCDKFTPVLKCTVLKLHYKIK
jgi:hypothetical protein